MSTTSLTYSQNAQKPDLFIPDSIERALEVDELQESLTKRILKDVGRFVAKGDVITAPVHGAIQAGNELLRTANSFGDWVADVTGLPLGGRFQVINKDGDFDPGYHASKEEAETAGLEELALPNVSAPESITGEVVSHATQFISVFGPTLRALKALNITRKTSPLAQATAAGALADFVGFDPYEARLSNLMVDYGPEAIAPVFEYLKADQDDGELEGRLKQSLEGMGLGLGVHGVLQSFKTMKRFLTHKERVKSLTGGEGETPREIFDIIKEIAHASESLNEEQRLHHHLREELQKTQAKFKSMDEAYLFESELKNHGVDLPSKGAASDVLLKAETRFLEILESDTWRTLSGAAKEDLESHFIRHESRFSKKLQKALAKDRKDRARRATDLLELSDFVGAEDAKNAVSSKTSKLKGRGINFKAVQTDKDAESLLKSLETKMAGEINKAGNAGRTWKETEEIAIILGKDPQHVQQNLQSLFGSSKLMDGQIRAAHTFLHSLFEDLQRQAKLADLGELGETGMVEFIRLQKLAENTLLQFNGLKSNLARTMNSLKMPLSQKDLTPNIAGEVLRASGGAAHQRQVAKLIASASSPQAISKIVAPSVYERIRDGATEYYINAILSGPTTHAVNVASTALNTLYQPLERMAGGLIAGDKNLIAEGTAMYRGLSGSLFDVVKLTSKGVRLNMDSPYVGCAKSFWEDRNLLDQSTSLFDAAHKRNALSAQNLGVASEVPLLEALKHKDYGSVLKASLAHALDFVSKLVNLPGRFLTSEDEFFKVLNYRMALRAEGVRQVKESGDPLILDKLLSDPKAFGAHEVALEHASKVTFTNPLYYGLGQWISEGVARFPEMRLLMPFIRTPTNLIRFTHHRTPFLNLMSREFRSEIFSKDPRTQKLALGKMTMGWMLWASAITMVKEGKIQGGLDQRPGRYDAARNAGILEYSFITTDKDGKRRFTQFDRADPFGMFFGMAADMGEIMGKLEEDDADQLAAAAVIALSRNLNARSYFTGLTNFLTALSDGDRWGKSFILNYSKGLIPNFIRQTRKTTDLWGDADPHKRILPDWRELKDLLDHMKGNLPGYSKDFPKALNIFGEEVTYPMGYGMESINPFYSSKEVDNPIAHEMFRLDLGASLPGDKVGGVRLTPKERYVKWSPLSRPKILKIKHHFFPFLRPILGHKPWTALSSPRTDEDGDCCNSQNTLSPPPQLLKPR